MFERHRVFASYHPTNDEGYKNVFNLRFGRVSRLIVQSSVQLANVDAPGLDYIRQRIRTEFLRDSCVTAVLVGVDTWRQKHIDWEINTSLRATLRTGHSGLLGILLPTFVDAHGGADQFPMNKFVLPPRLADNVEGGFAKLHDWNEDPAVVREWIHEAYLRRERVNPTNTRPVFSHNYEGDSWWV